MFYLRVCKTKIPIVVFLGWLVDNQMWGRAAMLVEEMGDEWGRVSFRLDRELIKEYAAELWGMKIDYVDVEEHGIGGKLLSLRTMYGF